MLLQSSHHVYVICTEQRLDSYSMLHTGPQHAVPFFTAGTNQFNSMLTCLTRVRVSQVVQVLKSMVRTFQQHVDYPLNMLLSPHSTMLSIPNMLLHLHTTSCQVDIWHNVQLVPAPWSHLAGYLHDSSSLRYLRCRRLPDERRCCRAA
jgi:hypothetical protein